jgi:hypothetical protein
LKANVKLMQIDVDREVRWSLFVEKTLGFECGHWKHWVLSLCIENNEFNVTDALIWMFQIRTSMMHRMIQCFLKHSTLTSNVFLSSLNFSVNRRTLNSKILLFPITCFPSNYQGSVCFSTELCLFFSPHFIKTNPPSDKLNLDQSPRNENFCNFSTDDKKNYAIFVVFLFFCLELITITINIERLTPTKS